MIYIYSILSFFAWWIIGAAVLGIIDEDPYRPLYRWYADAPEQISWFTQPLVLTLWPIVAVVWIWAKHRGQK